MPENFDFIDDGLHVRVTEAIKAKAEKMYQEAMENPRSDANDMLHILMLNAVANLDAGAYRDPRVVLTEERHRGAEFEHRAEMDQHRVAQLERQKRKDEEEIKLIKLRVRELQQKVDEGDRQLAEALEAAEKAKKALENGEPLDAMSVYNRIAEIVGLRVPAGEKMADIK